MRAAEPPTSRETSRAQDRVAEFRTELLDADPSRDQSVPDPRGSHSTNGAKPTTSGAGRARVGTVSLVPQAFSSRGRPIPSRSRLACGAGGIKSLVEANIGGIHEFLHAALGFLRRPGADRFEDRFVLDQGLRDGSGYS